MLFVHIGHWKICCNHGLHVYVYFVCLCVCVLRYGKEHPHFFIGSLESAMKEVVSSVEDPDQVSMVLLFSPSAEDSNYFIQLRGGSLLLLVERVRVV